MERIGLTEAFTALRSEMTGAIRDAQGEDLRFQVNDISMEFQVEVEHAVGGSGGVKFWVIELGAEASRSSTRTHTLTLNFAPVTTDGRPVLTGGASVPD